MDPAGNRAVAEEAATNPFSEQDLRPGFFGGVPTGIGMGTMRGGANASRALSILAAAPMSVYERATGQEGRYTDPWFQSVDETAGNAVDYWTPDANSVGTAGRVLGGFAEMILPLAATAGDPALLMASAETNTAADLVKQGVDSTTAVNLGLAQGASTAIGFRLPILGKTLGGRIGTGMLGNTSANAATAAASQAVLQSQGYGELAKQFDPYNLEARAVDALSGIAFGGIHHLGTPREATPAARDAALAAANARHYQQETAPGTPADIAAEVAHQDAMEVAFGQTLRGEPVSVPDAVTEADFTPRADAPAMNLPPELKAHDASRLVDEIPRADNGALTPEQKLIEGRLATDLGSNFEDAIRRYSKLEDSAGGKILNTDVARDLSPDYLADRTQSAAVHEPASWFVKRLYAMKLAEEPRLGEKPLVVFSAGGTGAGKTTALEHLIPDTVKAAQLVYDTNMNKLSSAIDKIEQALAAGKLTRIVYVYREPIEALKNGALSRAMRQEKEHGTGRTVPISEHLKTHTGAREVIDQIAAHYAGDERVQIQIIDNSMGRGKAKLSGLGAIPKFPAEAHNQLREQAIKTLDAELSAGRISERVHSGFAPKVDGRGVAGAQGRKPSNGAADGRQPEQAVRSNQGVGSGAEPSVVFTSAGRPVEVKPRLVEADSLITSDRPGYPKGIQPRHRGKRAASSSQINDIASKLRPAELGASATADTGAPIIGPDNAVESGNGRVMALRAVYKNHPEREAAYRSWLESQGYDLTGMKEPVLVRERVTQMTDAERQAFAVEANKPGVAEMSPVELAQSDAKALDDAVLSQLEGGDVTLEKNSGFVRSFLAKLTESERGGMLQADGTLSQKGVRRIEGAILAKAYGETPESAAILARILESTDNDVRSVTAALMDAAPEFAKMREAIGQGRSDPSYDIAANIVKAVDELVRIRRTGQAPAEALGQVDLLNPRDPKVTDLLKTFYNDKMTRLASREKIGGMLKKYAEEAQRVNLNQGDIFGDKPPAAEAMLKAIRGDIPEPTAVPQEDLFAVNPARQVAQEISGPIATGEFNPDGSPRVESAEQAMARGDAEIEKAQNDAKGIEAAVACFLSRGMAA